MRYVGLILLGFLIFVCLIPFYSVVIVFPVTLIVGPAKWLYYVQMVAVYLLSAGSAIWIVQRLWNPKPKLQPPDSN